MTETQIKNENEVKNEHHPETIKADNLPMISFGISTVGFVVAWFMSAWWTIIMSVIAIGLAAYAYLKNKFKINLVAIGIGVLVLVVGIIRLMIHPEISVFTFPTRSQNPTPTTITTQTTGDLKVTNFQLIPKTADSPAQVTGTLTNQGNESYNTPIVSFTGFNEQNEASLDTCFASHEGSMTPNETWEFTAVCGEQMNPVRVELLKVSYTEKK